MKILVHVPDREEVEIIEIENENTIAVLIERVHPHDHEEWELFIEGEQTPRHRNHRLHEAGICDGHHVHLHRRNHVHVAVVTTSGTWPPKGFETVPIHQPVKAELEHAVRELKITDTTNWIAKVGGRELKVDQNYHENGLRCKVEIDYGPREGGGGNE